jgi:hypothetical protein
LTKLANAYVSRNIKQRPSKSYGKLVHAFVTKHGIPVFWFKREDAVIGEDFLPTQASPGMVGIDIHEEALWTVLDDGTVTRLPVSVVPIENEFEPKQEKESQPA